MAEVSLGRLRVVEGAVAHRAVGRAEREAADVELVAAAVTVLGRFVHNLHAVRRAEAQDQWVGSMLVFVRVESRV